MKLFDQIQRGTAFFTDAEGRVLKWIRDDLGLFDGFAGQTVFDLFHADAHEKVGNFLKAATTDGAAFGWELTVPEREDMDHLYFTGGMAADGLLIVVTPACDVGSVCQEFLRMLNEQTNTLRSAMKELSARETPKRDREGEHLYEELSKLNNDLVTLQRELAKKNEELNRLNALKTRFLGMASHDLRKPLGVVLMHTDLLLDAEPVDLKESQIELLKHIRENSSDMLKSLGDFLDIAQIDSGKLSLNLGLVDFAMLLRRRIPIHQAFAKKKGITLEAHLPETSLVATLDEKRIQQVVDNLVENAIKYSPAHTTIKVELSTRPDKLLLLVRDQGVGIPVEAGKNLFRLFATAEKPLGGEKSTGLGLAIVKAIVTQHKGNVWFESEPGKGTTFFVSLPLE